MKNRFSALIVSFILVLFVSNSLQASDSQKTTLADQYLKNVYDLGGQIAEGVSLSLITGMSALDQELKYSIDMFNDSLTVEKNTWPLKDVTIPIESKKLGNFTIQFILLLEVDQSTQAVVGTVKNIKVDNNRENSLTMLNNTMYTETEAGTEQVELIDGSLRFVEN